MLNKKEKGNAMPIILLVVILVFSYPAEAQLGRQEIDDCLLTYLKAARLDQVSILIRSTCQATYRKPNFLRKEERENNLCLLENLQGVESSFAADTIIRACNRRHLNLRRRHSS